MLIAYIGPGGGLVITFSLLSIVLTIALIGFAPVVYPFLAVYHWMRGKRAVFRRGFRRVVVLGLDGLDPKLVRAQIAAGKLPNMTALAQVGCFMELRTVAPAITPAAWSSFLTGQDPSHHAIFDFVTRDPATYLPKLSSFEVCEATTSKRFRKSRSRARLLRRGIPFWHEVANHRMEVTVLRVPITFPPERFRGRILSGMCVPDLLGTQGTYSYFASNDSRMRAASEDFYPLHLSDDRACTALRGPTAATSPAGNLVLRIKRTGSRISLKLGKQWQVQLSPGESSKWLRIQFGSRFRPIHALTRFYLKSAQPDVELYMSPLHLDPERSVTPISHPPLFSDYLAKKNGPFGTLGQAEDTSALNDDVLDEEGFLQHAWSLFEERRTMFIESLNSNVDDLTICVFDTPDRIQHMFWRYMECTHPAHEGQTAKHAHAIEEMLDKMDELVGETVRLLQPETLLLVISDHGFTSFRRGVDLNRWLEVNGYLHRRVDARPEAAWLDGIDWSRTRAFAMGLTGIFVNLRGREAKGIVDPGSELTDLLAQIKHGLEDLRDPQCDNARVIRRVRVAREEFQGPHRLDGPDLLVGYEAGYRGSWESAKGQVTDSVLHDNTRKWSGDHCVDPELVPGVLLANTSFSCENPHILDLAPTILDLFGIARTSTMQGRSLFDSETREF